MFKHADSRGVSRSGFIALALLVSPCCPLLAMEQSAPPAIAPAAPSAPPAHLVRELLEEDAQRALLNERVTAAPPTNPEISGRNQQPDADGGMATRAAGAAATTSVPLDWKANPIRLKTIMGVGRRLSALINVEGKDALYRSGQQRAVSGVDGGWRLLQIAPPCVELANPSTEADRRVQACLNEVSR